MRFTRTCTIAAVGITLSCGGEAPSMDPADYPGAVAVDPDHYTVEFENDAVRMLRIAYGPGETSSMHMHPPNCAIFLDDQPTTMELPDGEVVEEQPSAPGTVRCWDEAQVHLPTNAGSEPLELILVEMKEGGMAGSAPMSDVPHAAEADSDHYTVEFENDVARLVRVTYGPGESSVMHWHPAHCVVYVTDATDVTFELPDGQVVDTEPGERGAVNCVDAGAHLPTNGSDEALEVVLVELKGTASAGS